MPCRLPSLCAGGFALAIATGALGEDFTHRVTDPIHPDVLFPALRFETTAGSFVVELDRRRAPVTVNNFLAYVVDGAWEGTIFHRVVPGFVVQGGGYGPDFGAIETREPIMNESGNGLANDARSIAMARHADPHSATSQFYFNLAANESLDPNPRSWGYTVFGTIIEGWEVIESMGEVETGYAEALGAGDVPVEPIVLERVELLR